MRCLLCYANISDDESACPRCGDHVEKWRELDQRANLCVAEGARCVGIGDLPQATLAFFKAVVLQPDDPVALCALGKSLAQQKYYSDARYYLARAMEVSKGDDPARPALRSALEKATVLIEANAETGDEEDAVGVDQPDLNDSGERAP